MAVPKRKTTQSKRNMRRAHDSLKQVNVMENPTTGELTRRHHISLDGYYKGRQIFEQPTTKDDSELEETL